MYLTKYNPAFRISSGVIPEEFVLRAKLIPRVKFRFLLRGFSGLFLRRSPS